MGLFHRHKWSKWEEIGYHLERKCQKCNKKQVMLPDPFVVVLFCARDILLKLIEKAEVPQNVEMQKP